MTNRVNGEKSIDRLKRWNTASCDFIGAAHKHIRDGGFIHIVQCFLMTLWAPGSDPALADPAVRVFKGLLSSVL